MKRVILLFLFSFFVSTYVFSLEENPSVLVDFLQRIGGEGCADKFILIVDESLSKDGKDKFIITSKNKKPCIRGNSLLSVTTGLNWYFNHYANINFSWGNMSIDLDSVDLPLPTKVEERTCSAEHRYYLNYCTFSYSMSVWTWERWQQEIDWMALHGINMLLQIVGLDVVWKKLLMTYYGYSLDDVNKFVAGPCFQAWWGMNNLEGWGGPNPEWWYARQEQLAKKIGNRMREFGMQPVLPGFSGMVPSDFMTKTNNSTLCQGNWCFFYRPHILDPNSKTFAKMAKNYYEVLHEVMGKSCFYSMDPFHEGANTSGIDVAKAYSSIAEAMYEANSDIDEKWVIQFWQWSEEQYKVLDEVKQGNLIVLDLFADAYTHFDELKNHDAVYCMLPNFGGRTGLMGRFDGNIESYFSCKSLHPNLKGIGATPEAIESMPVLYDLLFELPWLGEKPSGNVWLKNYTTSRYGKESSLAQEAWEKLRLSVLNCTTTLQGPHEAVVCARPSLEVEKVSSWGGTDIFYDPQNVVAAAKLLLEANLDGNNYHYDLIDVVRQSITDYAYFLLKAIRFAKENANQQRFVQLKDVFLRLILDLDELLSTNRNFMLGRWTQMARGITDEVCQTTEADKQWLEHANVRTLITTWGGRPQANDGGLRDYSYRQWAGMLKDYYYLRWKMFFDDIAANYDWFEFENDWINNQNLVYSDSPIGDAEAVAERLFQKYFVEFTLSDNSVFYIYRAMETDKTSDVVVPVARDAAYVCPALVADESGVTFSVDFNNDGCFSANETADGLQIDIPATSTIGHIKAKLTLSDGTVFFYTLFVKDLM